MASWIRSELPTCFCHLQSRRSLQYRRKQTFPLFVNPAKENLSEDDNALYFLSPDVNFTNLDNISAPSYSGIGGVLVSTNLNPQQN